MRARQLIDGAAFGPDALKTIGAAFDGAWSEIAKRFGSDPLVIEAARLRLANALLSIANEESRDVAVLKQAALHRMAVDYRGRPDDETLRPKATTRTRSRTEKPKLY